MADSQTAGEKKLNVFISYSRQDIKFVDRLQAALKVRGIAAFVDREDIAKGEDWWARIKQLIIEADTIVFTLSPGSVDSKVCKDEVELAEKLNKRFVPIVALELEGRTVPAALARLNYIFFIPNPTGGASGDFDAAVDDLVRTLETDIFWIREHTRIGTLAERWESLKRPTELLLRGADLTAAENWLTTRPEKAPDPTDAHRALITLSRRAATRRQRLTLAVSLVAAAVGFSLSGLAYWQRSVAVSQRDELQHQRASMLGQLASTEFPRGNIERALQLSAHGARLDLELPGTITASPAASQLATALSHTDWRLRLRGEKPDGMRIVKVGDKTVRVWNAAKGNELRGHDFTVIYAALNPDGSRIATAPGDMTARVWDARTGHEIIVLSGHEGTVLSAAFSPDGMFIVTASEDKTLRLWDARVGIELMRLRGHEGAVLSAAFSPDGRRIVSASSDKTARFWDVTTGNEIKTLRGHEGAVTAGSFSPDGMSIVTASEDKTLRFWDARVGIELMILRGHEGAVLSAAFSPDGRRIVSASSDKTARIWDARTGHEVLVLRGHETPVLFAAFSSDGTSVAAASDGEIMTTKALLTEACTRRLFGIAKLSRNDMRLAGYGDDQPEIDVCVGVQ